RTRVEEPRRGARLFPARAPARVCRAPVLHIAAAVRVRDVARSHALARNAEARRWREDHARRGAVADVDRHDARAEQRDGRVAGWARARARVRVAGTAIETGIGYRVSGFGLRTSRPAT